MKINPFRGTGIALVTPFKQDRSVDIETLERIVNHVIDNGADFLVVLGTTSEAPTLTAEEKNLVINTILKTNNHRLPVLLGVGGNNTAAVIDFSRTAEALGVDGLLIVTPYYNKTTQKGLVAHYGAICEQVHIPIIVYNVPSRTGLNVLPATMKEIMEYIFLSYQGYALSSTYPESSKSYVVNADKGKKLLGAGTVAMLHANQLGEAQLKDFTNDYLAGYGYGYGFRTLLTQEFGHNGHIGCFGWTGGSGIWVEADPVDRFSIAYMQNMMPNEELYHHHRVRATAYGIML